LGCTVKGAPRHPLYVHGTKSMETWTA
jgi:hypothetical protein